MQGFTVFHQRERCDESKHSIHCTLKILINRKNKTLPHNLCEFFPLSSRKHHQTFLLPVPSQRCQYLETAVQSFPERKIPRNFIQKHVMDGSVIHNQLHFTVSITSHFQSQHENIKGYSYSCTTEKQRNNKAILHIVAFQTCKLYCKCPIHTKTDGSHHARMQHEAMEKSLQKIPFTFVKNPTNSSKI